MALPLEIRNWGEGGRRRILLLHGLSSHRGGWWRVGPALAERGWWVTAADLRGHGSSPRGDDYRLDSYTADVLALGRGWDAVLGHSLGGALAVMGQTLDTGFARRIVLCDPALLMAAVPVEEAVGWLTEAYERPNTVAVTAEANPTWHPEDVRLKVEAIEMCPRTVVEATVRENPDWNLIAETSALDVPTTIIGGDPEHGGIVPVTVGEWFAAENPSIEYAMIPGSGHSAHREPVSYEAFMDIVTRVAEEPV